MKLRWKIWHITCVVYFIYCIFGYIASHDKEISLQLTPNQSTSVTLFSFNDRVLEMELWFNASFNNPRSEELGEWWPYQKNGNILIFENPGEPVEIAVSLNGEPLLYSAMPNNGQGAEVATKRLYPKQELPNGQWEWSYSALNKKSILLKSGFNTIQLRVLRVGEALLGEVVTLDIYPELQGRFSGSTWVEWLRLYFVWPVMLFILILWAMVMKR